MSSRRDKPEASATVQRGFHVKRDEGLEMARTHLGLLYGLFSETHPEGSYFILSLP